MSAELMIKKFETVEVFFMENGWFNATKVAVHYGQEPKDWLSLPKTLDLILAIMEKQSCHVAGFNKINGLWKELKASKMNADLIQVKVRELIKQTEFVKVKRGSPENGGGTWLHPKLAVHFGYWVNVQFAVWVGDQVEIIIQRINEEQQPTFPVELHPVLNFLVVGPEEDRLMKRTRNTYTSMLDELGFAAAIYKRHLTNNVSNILIGMPVKPFRRLYGIPAGSPRRTRLFYDSDLRRTMDEIEKVSCRRLRRERPESFDTIQQVVYEIARAARQYALVQGIELTEHVPSQELSRRV